MMEFQDREITLDDADDDPDRDPATGCVATVVIGRNEGTRLERCLSSLGKTAGRVVYVDSGSKDRSVEIARAAGAEVVVLDASRPYTAARGRNAGLAALMASATRPEYVQFIDGDCTLQPGWLVPALAFLNTHPLVAAVCGRRRERHPEASVYNRLCDREWNTNPGETTACGGDALVRLAAINQVGGYTETMIAGEEPELCVRLRQQGWRIWRLDREMTLHDAEMLRFGQWWRRMIRGGHAFAEGAAMDRAGLARQSLAGAIRALVWGLWLPVVAGALALTDPLGLGLLLAYPVQVLRMSHRDGIHRRAAWEWAVFTTLGKLPEMVGVVSYWAGRLLRRPRSLMEYKLSPQTLP